MVPPVAVTHENITKLETVKAVDLLLHHPDFCINILSRFYPLNVSILEKYSDLWDQEELSLNINISGSLDLIEQFGHFYRWFLWDALANVKSHSWTAELIEKYSAYLHADNEHERGGLCSNDSVPWTGDLIEKYKEELQKRDERWINRAWDEWEAEAEARNKERRQEEYENFCDADGRYSGPDEPDDEDEAEKQKREHADEYESTTSGFDALSLNSGLPWSIELLERFKDQWNWQALSSNRSIPWSEELIKIFYDRWDLKLLNKTLSTINNSHDEPINSHNVWQSSLEPELQKYQNEDSVSALLDLLNTEEALSERYSNTFINMIIWQKIFSRIMDDDLVDWVMSCMPKPIDETKPLQKATASDRVVNEPEVRLEDIPF